MRSRILVSLFPLFALAACGGGSSNEPPQLQGLWYGLSAVDLSTYVTPYVITQSGRDLLVTSCNRSTTALRFGGDKLLFTDGSEFYYQPDGENALRGTHRASVGEWRRFSTGAVFASGRVAVSVPSVAPLQASQDVCADKTSKSYQFANGTQAYGADILVTAPHAGSFMQVKMSFGALRAGDYTVRDANGLLENFGTSVLVELQSPAFAAVYGGSTLKINAGTVRVGLAASGAYTFEGVLVTESSAQVPFSAELTLERRP